MADADAMAVASSKLQQVDDVHVESAQEELLTDIVGDTPWSA